MRSRMGFVGVGVLTGELEAVTEMELVPVLVAV